MLIPFVSASGGLGPPSELAGYVERIAPHADGATPTAPITAPVSGGVPRVGERDSDGCAPSQSCLEAGGTQERFGARRHRQLLFPQRWRRFVGGGVRETGASMADVLAQWPSDVVEIRTGVDGDQPQSRRVRQILCASGDGDDGASPVGLDFQLEGVPSRRHSPAARKKSGWPDENGEARDWATGGVSHGVLPCMNPSPAHRLAATGFQPSWWNLPRISGVGR